MTDATTGESFVKCYTDDTRTVRAAPYTSAGWVFKWSEPDAKGASEYYAVPALYEANRAVAKIAAQKSG